MGYRNSWQRFCFIGGLYLYVAAFCSILVMWPDINAWLQGTFTQTIGFWQRVALAEGLLIILMIPAFLLWLDETKMDEDEKFNLRRVDRLIRQLKLKKQKLHDG